MMKVGRKLAKYSLLETNSSFQQVVESNQRIDSLFQQWEKVERENPFQPIEETPTYASYHGNGLDLNNNFVMQLNEAILEVP